MIFIVTGSRGKGNIMLLLMAAVRASAGGGCSSAASTLNDTTFDTHAVVTTQAMGARCVVAGDLDGDGDADLVSASSTDNTVAWYENLGAGGWSQKREITYVSNGARIVTVGDVDSDGDLDVIAASYYDNTVRWFENDGTGNWLGGKVQGAFSGHTVTTTAMNAQGVAAADIDQDGDLDLVTASSGDNSVAWYENLGGGRFCELKTLVDTNAVGVRTVVAADLDGDGTIDLASASKDDHTIAWYPNLDGTGSFGIKLFVANGTAKGAYSLVALDVDQDGYTDLVTASNGDDTVAFYRNTDGKGSFERTVIYDNADFVLSVTAGDFDRDGDIDVASASYFDGAIRWYENLDGTGRSWRTHPLYQVETAQGHYVSTGDVDGDGDTDLLAVTMAENAVNVFRAATKCDNTTEAPTSECCVTGQRWNGTRCVACIAGTYGVGTGSGAACVACPASACSITGLVLVPPTCSGITGCMDAVSSAMHCDCGADLYKDPATDTCVMCPDGQHKPAGAVRTPEDLSDTSMWPGFDPESCILRTIDTVDVAAIIGPIGAVAGAMLLGFIAIGAYRVYMNYMKAALAQAREFQAKRQRVIKAQDNITLCNFFVCFVKYTDFVKQGELCRHEIARRNGNITWLDEYEEVKDFVIKHPTAFVSHQWLGFVSPDPNGIHFRAICKAMDALCEQESIDRNELHLWLDYSSIPQKNNFQKALSISSIGMYASVCRYFVIVCPKTFHADTDAVVGPDTYQRRGWCRLEQWARMTVGGLKNMFIYDDALLPLSDREHWYLESIKVMDGEFTDPKDKPKLVDTVLGLWSIALDFKAHADNQTIHDLVTKHKQQVFPVEFFDDLVEILEEERRTMNDGSLDRALTTVFRGGKATTIARKGSGMFRLFDYATGSTSARRGSFTISRSGTFEKFPSLGSLSRAASRPQIKRQATSSSKSITLSPSGGSI